MLNAKQLYNLVIVPALKDIDLYSESAAKLVLYTAMVESRLVYLKQLGNGPALGLFQMEPATHKDIWLNYLKYQPILHDKLKKISYSSNPEQLVYNLKYAAAMCRIHYRRVREPLPDKNDLEGMGRYWKKYYNTYLGKGSVAGFINKIDTIGV